MNERASRATPPAALKLSRRQFIEGAGATGGALALGLAADLPTLAEAPATAAGALKPAELSELRAILARLLPADELGPGAVEAGVDVYIDQALGDVYALYVPAYQQLLTAIDYAATTYGAPTFADLPTTQQDIVHQQIEAGNAPIAPSAAAPAGGAPVANAAAPTAANLAQSFQLLLAHLREGMFGDPMYGGNQQFAGWDLIGYPGIKLSWSAADQTIGAPVPSAHKSAKAYGGAPYNGPIPQG